VLDAVEKRFREVCPAVEFCSLRLVRERTDLLAVRQGVTQPPRSTDDCGAMVTVMDGGGLGYAASSDLSAAGLKSACERARKWAGLSAGRAVTDFRKVRLPHTRGEYFGPVERPWSAAPLADKLALLAGLCKELKTDRRIVDWEASAAGVVRETLYLTNGGGRVHQRFHYLLPAMYAVASERSQTQMRSFGRLRDRGRQGGMEVLDAVRFTEQPARIAREAIELLEAPNCPTGRRDLLLAPDQMILQMHESIGHPLELDRILGDERNFAGTSFVTLDMLGTYRYGSDLLNVAYDPTRSEELASFAYDDDGCPARKEYLIRNGILQRPQGGLTSQVRAGIAGTASCRVVSWNRPTIDRISNLNIEPGTSKLEEMIAAVERGVYLQTNNCYSIDDSRNKFQFGSEWGRLIEDGRLTTVVKNPNYRGISATFWRNLKMLGDASTMEVLNCTCGKGEPYQEPRVGHASPACLFADVEVFGGA
jgi:predicted Zn-dependent protease